MNFFDLHCDTASECFKQSTDFGNMSLAVNFGAAECFEKWYQCFAVFIDDTLDKPYEHYKDVLKLYRENIKSAPDNLTPVLTVEGGALIKKDISRVDELKSDGVSALTLTWNYQNPIASGALTEGGVTDFGKAVINRMNKLNIACDLSHLNHESFLQAVYLAKRPLATHSCLNEVCKHPRNLNLSDVSLIAEKDGIFGICLYPAFLGGNVLQNFYRNVYLLLDKGFENNIAIGSDFDGADMTGGIKSTLEIPILYKYLLNRGISEEQLKKLFFENAYNFFL